MGFALTLLYLATTYLGPSTVFGPLAAYRVELLLAALVFLVSLPAIPRSMLLKTPQSLALLGLTAAVFLSILVTGWAGGAVQALEAFLPNAFAFFLVCIHANSRRKLQTLIVMMIFVCLFVVARGSMDLLHGVPAGGPSYSEATENADYALWNFEHPYLLPMRNSNNVWFYRLRGQNQINDPNDFGQVLVCVIPLLFMFWRPKRNFLNFIVVLLPACALLAGTFLTHSRGALVALAVMSVLLLRRRIGTIPSAVLAVGLFAAAMTYGFSGGRDLGSGSGRMVLWAESIGLLKAHPLFGVGFQRILDFQENTTHNSIMVCAAELGMFGLYFWTMFLLATLRDVKTLSSPAKVSEGMRKAPEASYFPQAGSAKAVVNRDEIVRMGKLMMISLAGYLVTGFFLSRALVTTFFLLGGVSEVIYQLALEQEMVPQRFKMKRLLLYAAPLSIGLVVGVYIFIRIGILF